MATILVVDDESALCEVIARTLAVAGHEVSQASDGRRALDLLRQKPADLVITDLVMPEQDGVETIIALRQLFPTLPVIAMSGNARNAPLYLEIATRLGVRRTLAKPFTAAVLVNAVSETLAHACAA